MRRVARRLMVEAGWGLGKTYLRSRVGGGRARKAPPRTRRVGGLAAAAGAGALMAYVLDPQQGRRRRALARDRTRAVIRRSGERTRRIGVAAGAQTYGLVQRATHLRRQDVDPNEPTLKHIIESEVLHRARFDASRVNVNVEDGIVVLRGILDTPDEIREVQEACLKVEGVRGIENYLHLPNTPAPNTAEVRQVIPDSSNVIN